MALKSGIVCCLRRALGLSKPAISASPSIYFSQHLSTLKAAPLTSNFSPSLPSNHVFKLHTNSKQTLLSQAQQAVCCVHYVRQYHSVLRPRLHCKGCYFVWRHGRKYVECSDVPSHKQMKKVITRKLWREDYTKGNVRKAMIWNRDLTRISDRMCDRDALSHNWLASRIGKDV